MSGKTCLKNLVLFELMDRLGLEGDEWWETFGDIQAMESAALEAMHKPA